MDREQAMTLLKSGPDGVKKWNDYRANPDNEVPSLELCDLSNANLRQANLVGINLSRAKLVSATLLDADLSNACLVEADLRYAKFGNTSFDDANCSKANFSLTESYTTPKGISFKKTLLRAAIFQGANLPECEFQDANLQDADIGAANFSGATRRSAGLRGQNTVDLAPSNFIDADLTNASLALGQFVGCVFIRATLSSADLSYSDFTRCDFSGSQLADAVIESSVLRQANLRNANLDGVTLVDVDLSEANLRGVGSGTFLNSVFPFNTYPFTLDDCHVRSTRFSPAVQDRWSKLRRAYTGPLFAVHLLLLIVFLVPLASRTIFWLGVNRLEQVTSATIDERHVIWNSQVDFSAIEFKERSVFSLAVGWDRGALQFGLLMALMLYNAARGSLTYRVSLLREEEERSGHCPAFREYSTLYRMHQVNSVLFFLAATSFLWNLIYWLSRPVYVPW